MGLGGQLNRPPPPFHPLVPAPLMAAAPSMAKPGDAGTMCEVFFCDIAGADSVTNTQLPASPNRTVREKGRELGQVARWRRRHLPP